MQASAHPKKACAKCDKSLGAFSCGGCQQSFCLKHVAEHRQELTHQMDLIEQEHDLLHEDLSTQSEKHHEHPLFELIDRWQRESIEKIEQVAKDSRAELTEILRSITDHGKKNLQRMSVRLHRARDSDGFFENDLNRWSQQLIHLREEIKYMSETINIVTNPSSSAVHSIQITPKRTPEHSETTWTSPSSWFSDVKALFSIPSGRSAPDANEKTSKITAQTLSKGSISISNVDHLACSVDLENDAGGDNDQTMTGWTLRREVNSNSKVIYQFPDGFILRSRSHVRIVCGKQAAVEEQATREILINNDLVDTWESGTNVITSLIDPDGEEKATMVQTLPAL